MADAAAGTTEDASVTFNVKASSGPKVTVTLPLSTTVADLKTKLAEPDMANVPVTSQRLIYSGKVLKDHETLATHNVKEGNTMHLVRSAASNQRQNPASQSTSTSTGQTAPSPAASIPQNFASGTGNDPLVGLTGARYAGFAGMPNLQELANPPTPEEMIRRLQDPNFAQMMNEALSNPQMIDMMINQNPQLRAMGPQARQILQSDSFRRMLTNPEYMRGIMEMQRMAGNNPFGGGGGEAFPMPGATATTDAQHQTQGQTQNQTQPQGQQQDPFAGMFGGGGMNPFMFMQPPPAGSDRSADSTNNPTAGQANPFAALFNPAMFQPQNQPASNADNTSSATPDPNNPLQQPNPFAGNPLLQNMNNPMMQQMMQNMMNNPEAMRNAMQMLSGGEGAGGLGAFGGLGGGLGGFGAPPDNRPPEERFSTQLRQLNEMGFYNFDQNVQALTRSGGDVNGALEWLFSQPPS